MEKNKFEEEREETHGFREKKGRRENYEEMRELSLLFIGKTKSKHLLLIG